MEERIYAALRAIAQRQMRGERVGHTLTSTALVHEAYIRLREQTPADDPRFYFAAAEAMRRILIDHARRRGAAKRGAGLRRVADVLDLAAEDKISDALILDDLLLRLEQEDPRAAQVVRLRFYAGLSLDDTARVLGVSTPTVKREWAYARAWILDAWQHEGDA
ncbi:MAG: sigma-70 family RNA polymerase sigma factor [Phycisphaerales bacterium]|nr:sigma-70 family RNA polymerase sigma factor [Phycisphaerales bacterium]